MRVLLSAFVLLLVPFSASATFHLWHITEVYSNADGSVQFVEMKVENPFDNENQMAGKTLKSTSTTFTIPSNLPTTTTTHYLLFATPAFASQPCEVSPGVFTNLTPDYTFAAANFMSTAGDSITFAVNVDTFTYTGGELPTDGVNSLNEPYLPSQGPRTTAANSPTNFAGQTCPEPSGWLALPTGAALLLGLARARRPA